MRLLLCLLEKKIAFLFTTRHIINRDVMVNIGEKWLIGTPKVPSRAIPDFSYYNSKAEKIQCLIILKVPDCIISWKIVSV